jgi:hypothetical protein
MDKYSRALFSDKFNVQIDDIFGPKLRELERRGLLNSDGNDVALTPEGILAMGEIEDYINNA